MISKFLKTFFKSPKDTCIDLHKKAKVKKPGRNNQDCLKLVLLTKPPFDYQLDPVINETLKEFNTIDKLADFITDIEPDNYLWKNRERNLRIYKKKLESRNNLFFKEFWGNK